MFLQGAFLGMSYFKDIKDIQAQVYKGIKFFGECIIDNVHVLRTRLTDDDISTIDPSIRPKWSKDTLMLATFDNTLENGNIPSGLGTVEKWLIYKNTTKNNKLIKVAEVDANETEYNDYKLSVGKTYSYQLFPQTSTKIGRPIATEAVENKAYSWFLIDEDTKQVFKFKLDVSSSDITSNVRQTEYVTNNKYPTIDFSDVDYITGSVQCICGDVDESGNAIGDDECLKKIKTFINNNKPKILKAQNGDMWNVTTKNFSYKILDETTQQIATMKFDFTEVGEV